MSDNAWAWLIIGAMFIFLIVILTVDAIIRKNKEVNHGTRQHHIRS
jgi:hypothetical protein